MVKRKLGLEDLGSLVYSTDPEVLGSVEEEDAGFALEPGKQRLKVSADRKARKGKVVTLIEGFEGSSAELERLARELKTHCGSGGSAKDGIIVIQGNMVEKVRAKLRLDGYHVQK